MSTEVETGHKSEFWLADGAAVLTKLAEVTNVPIPAGAAELIKASHMETEGFHDYIQAPLQEGEEVDVEVNWVPGSATDLLCQGAKGKVRAYKIVLQVGAGTYEFEGSVLVRDYKRSNPMEDRRSGVLTIKWVGDTDEGAGA